MRWSKILKFNRWHDDVIDTGLFLQLQDLTTVLSAYPDLTFKYSNGSYIDPVEKKLTGSTLWDATLPNIQEAGYKTDVYLRAIGTLHLSDLYVMNEMIKTFERSPISKFVKQLFTLLEDFRIQNILIKKRPGMIQEFSIRNDQLNQYFASQRLTNYTRGFRSDELFCMLYLMLFSDQPVYDFSPAHSEQIDLLEQMLKDLYQVHDALTTEEILFITKNIAWKLPDSYQDMENQYFSFPIFQAKATFTERTLFDELKRLDDIEGELKQKLSEDDHTYEDETFSTWHRENKNRKQNEMFLRMDLEMGSKTNLKGGAARETESSDQAYTSVQGSAQQSNKTDYSLKDTLEEIKQLKGEKALKHRYGQANIHAVPISKQANKPTLEDIKKYHEMVKEIEPFKRTLETTIEKYIEHQQRDIREQMQYGRLAKNLLPLILEDFPRVFYKRNEPDDSFHAIFSLLVDCSSSMYSKMEDTKKAIVLFHEVLKKLKIPHNIIGFWEEANLLGENKQKNYFHEIHTLDDSLYEKNGPKIMQLQAEEDNRDGFSIRILTEQMQTRREEHKFLLVFTDGEPAAENYTDQGIVDTNIAVRLARKQGIYVVGIFIADGEVSERDEQMMRNIYGKDYLIVPTVQDLPELFSAVLRKLFIHIFR